MTNTMTRSLIETFVHSKLESLKEFPERTTRNLVDMALQFSKGGFQKRFFEIAQEMLRNEKSAYYHLIYHTISNVDANRLLTFGMNIGYNSCIHGAKIIRKLESQSDLNIPWCVTLRLHDDTADHLEHYNKLLQDSKTMGVYTWNIFPQGQLPYFFPVMEQHPDCAFLLFCTADEISERLLETLEPLHNIMFVIEYQESDTELFHIMQKKKQLYSAYLYYKPETINDICNGEIPSGLNATNSIFAFLFPDNTCSPEDREMIEHYVMEYRNEPLYKTVLFDFLSDTQRINRIITHKPDCK